MLSNVLTGPYVMKSVWSLKYALSVIFVIVSSRRNLLFIIYIIAMLEDSLCTPAYFAIQYKGKSPNFCSLPGFPKKGSAFNCDYG